MFLFCSAQTGLERTLYLRLTSHLHHQSPGIKDCAPRDSILTQMKKISQILKYLAQGRHHLRGAQVWTVALLWPPHYIIFWFFSLVRQKVKILASTWRWSGTFFPSFPEFWKAEDKAGVTHCRNRMWEWASMGLGSFGIQSMEWLLKELSCF